MRYDELMQGAQRIVVDWMKAQLQRHGWKPGGWAVKAGIAPTTISRAMHESYTSVTSLPTLHALAVAAGVPSVLDFLAAQTAANAMPGATRAVIGEVLTIVGCERDADTVSDAIMDALGTVARADSPDETFIKAAARAAVERVGL